MSDISPPVTYQQWLDCLTLLRGTSPSRSGVCEAMTRGTFSGSPVVLSALAQQLAEAIQAALTRTSQRFLRELNACLEFHDLTELELLCRRFRADIQRMLFFRELSFLPEEYRTALCGSVIREMSAFWSKILRILRQQMLEHPDPDLEDAVYQIGRIKLFPKQW